jgi:hypothetical protein
MLSRKTNKLLATLIQIFFNTKASYMRFLRRLIRILKSKNPRNLFRYFFLDLKLVLSKLVTPGVLQARTGHVAPHAKDQ